MSRNNKKYYHISKSCKDKFNKREQESKLKNKRYKNRKWKDRGNFMSNLKYKLRLKETKQMQSSKMGLLWWERYKNLKKVKMRLIKKIRKIWLRKRQVHFQIQHLKDVERLIRIKVPWIIGVKEKPVQY